MNEGNPLTIVGNRNYNQVTSEIRGDNMKATIYGFRLLIALTAFIFGIGAYSLQRYFQPFTKLQKLETISIPVKPDITTSIKPVQQVAPIEEVARQAESDFYASGEYYIIGKAPKGFEDFEYLEITTDAYDEKTDKVKPIYPEGFVLSKSKFSFSKIYINNKIVSFETETRKGISYKFTGMFFEHDEQKTWTSFDYDEKTPYQEEYIYLEGSLTKFRDGKKIAEKKIKFTVYGGC